jgi:hypothetical protein
MPKAELLRVQDVRDAYRLIGECRDLGSDPALRSASHSERGAWRTRKCSR